MISRKNMIFFLLLLLLASPAFAQLSGDRALPTDEYTDFPHGVLLENKADMVAAEQKAAESGQQVGAEPGKHISYDSAVKLYRAGEFAEALRGLLPLAQSGHPAAQELLGVMYRAGQGVSKDPAKAVEYLTPAANENRPLAQHYLGTMYFTGEGVAADPVQALAWLQIAILHYPDGPQKTRAQQDRDAVYTQLNRRDREAAQKATRDFLERKGEGHLLELQQ